VPAPASTVTKPQYVVLGALHVIGPVAVKPVARSIAAGDVTSTTQLVAPTDAGQFVLNQTLNDDPISGIASVALQPVVAIGTNVATPTVRATTSLTRSPDGVMSVHVSAVPTPDSAASIGALTADIVLSGDYLHVLSETVTVDAVAIPSVDNIAVSTPPTTPPNTPSSPPVNNGSSVIGMSTEGMDDQAIALSSITDGGSFPLLPSPSAGP
jgi:hypothetical protein